VITANNGDNVQMAASNTTVQGNYIGTSLTGGPIAIGPNTLYGIDVTTGSNNQIGGSSAAARNVICGNPAGGIFVSSNTNTFEGNFVGVDANGAINTCGNGALGGGGGIVVKGSNNLIGGVNGTTSGGPCTGSCNLIADNTGPAILMQTTALGIVITANSTFQDSGVGIQRTGMANDPVVAPRPTLVTGSGSSRDLNLTIPRCADTNGCPLQVFIADADNEEGQTLIGMFLMPTGNNQNNIHVTVSPVTSGQHLVAILTDTTGSSEFSVSVPVP
jgi:hypothetical protein